MERYDNKLLPKSKKDEIRSIRVDMGNTGKIKLVCVLLVLSVLWVMLVPFQVRADGDALKWIKIDKPGLFGNIVVSPSEVSEIAVGRSGTIYALDSEYSKVYQSADSGASWEDITFRLVVAGAGLPARKIAIAPDTTSTVAVVTNNGTKVYLSTDGGTTWTNYNVPGLAGTIQAIAISPQEVGDDASLRELAIGTANWGDNTTTGQVWVCQLGPVLSSWQDQRLTVDPGHVGGEVSAIAYSPFYQGDNTIIVVASTGSDVAANSQNNTWLCMGIRNTAARTTVWNAFSGYPVKIDTRSSPSGGDGFDIGVSGNISSSLALPSDYAGTDENFRGLFLSYNRDPNAPNDVYRFDDKTVYRLNANEGANINISSITYNGTTTSGKLLVGEMNPVGSTQTVRVRRTSNPFASSPTWQSASKRPSGPGNAKVSWSPEGDSAYCGTSQSPGAARDESAFSMSSDDGDNWQQLSLIDTTLKISDIAPAPGSDTLFLATYSAFGPESIWQIANSTQQEIGVYWSRQLTMATTSGRVILRLSPNYASDSTIYAVEAGGNQLEVSHDRGNSWRRRLAPNGVIDIAVEDENTLYAAMPGGYISKSTNGSFIWGELAATGLPAINMLAMAGKGTILAAGRNGEVAYSTDGGASFTRIDNVMDAGDVQVVADSNYQENGVIYAANNAPDKGIWRWTIGLSTSWEQVDKSITTRNTGQRIGGLAVGSEGTLYALRLEPASSNSGGMTRLLNPAARYDTEVDFDFTNDALPVGTTFDPTLVFSNTLPHLKISGDSKQNNLWAIDTANDIIYQFQDTLVTNAPTAILPSDKFQNKMNQIAGRAADIAFKWNSPSKNVTDYELGIYIDAACAYRIQLCLVPSTSDTPAVIIGPYQSNTTDRFVEYTPGTTYYWRVRSTKPIRSPWSETHSFTVEPIAALVTSLLSPANGGTGMSQTPAFSWSPISGTTEYRFVLANNAGLASPIVDTTVTTPAYAVTNMLELGQTYFWAVRTIAPIESGWSAIANFTVKEKPIEPPPPVVVTEAPPPVISLPAALQPSPEIVILPPPATPTVPTYIWVIVVIEAVLVITVVNLIVRIGR
jgi:photosystem II stability/assembly factor-like uncharacterized protein